MKIAGRSINSQMVPYIVAEIGAAHNGLLDRALTLMELAKRFGADAVKIQAFQPETITFDGAGDEFIIRSGPWSGRSLWDLYSQCAMPREWYGAMVDRAAALDITLFASVFSREDVRWMERWGCPAYKLASFELVDHDLIAAIAETEKPIIMSTGMADDDDVIDAMKAYFDGGNEWGLGVLHCVSEYPTPPSRANIMSGLGRLESMLKYVPPMGGVGSVVGLSDHTIGSEAAVVATVLGATIIEKHLTLSRGDGGPDDGFASEPHEFEAMVKAVRDARAMIRTPTGEAQDEHKVLRRSLYVVKDIRAGERFTLDNVRSIRPGNGLHPRDLPTILDRICKVDVKAGTAMSAEFVEFKWQK